MAESLFSLYLEHETLVNGLILLYGALIAAAYRNLRRIHQFLLKQYETEETEEALEALARENNESIIERIHEEFRFPFIASPYIVLVQRLSRRSLIFALGKRISLPRSRLRELLALVRGESLPRK
jgi:hypothetical protein